MYLCKNKWVFGESELIIAQNFILLFSNSIYFMYKLIVFDLDGTLLDTIEDLANSVNYALLQYNFPTHKTGEYRFFIGNGVNKLLERSLPEQQRNVDNVSMLKVEFLKHYYSHSDTFTKPYDGIVELMFKLQKNGFKLAVASNKIHQATVELTNRFFEGIIFKDVFGQREGFPVKPNPSILNEIVSNAKIDKSNVLYVGDSGVDVATAYNAGIDFVGVLWGFRPQSELEEVGAKVFVNNTEELFKIIASTN
jgi:phosphoglycolate phosphatase